MRKWGNLGLRINRTQLATNANSVGATLAPNANSVGATLAPKRWGRSPNAAQLGESEPPQAEPIGLV